MTLGEVLRFMEELDEGKHSQYDVPVRFYYDKLDQEVQETVISKEIEFRDFLTYLYSTYRKIEIQIGKAGCPGILADLESREKSLDLIFSNLEKAKNEYKIMERNDFLKMYPVLKKLFSCYIAYIRYSIDHTDKIYEGDHLPGIWEEIQFWLEELNTWSPKKVNIENINWMNSFITMSSGYEQVIQTLCKTVKFADYYVAIDNQGSEPFIRDEKNKKILFGFVNMEGAKIGQNSDNASILEVECLKECTVDTRRWICTKCGDYVSIKENQVGTRLLFCSCGSKKYNSELLICYHCSNRSQEQNTSQNEVIDYDELLARIQKELKKVKEREEGNTHINIYASIEYIRNKRSEEEIKELLRGIPSSHVNAITRHMIELYLNKDA